MKLRCLWLAATLLLLLVLPNIVCGSDEQEEEEKRRSIRLKTTGQLKKIFAELEINYQETMTKTQLQELAYQEDAVERWLELHPEKRRKKTPPSSSSFGEKPDGMDEAQWQRILAQMQGKKQANFDHIQDEERRSILTKLAAAGLVMPGSEDMEMEKLRNLAKILDNLGSADGGAGAGGAKDSSEEEENVQEL